jgi:hypothetical protein
VRARPDAVEAAIRAYDAAVRAGNERARLRALQALLDARAAG